MSKNAQIRKKIGDLLGNYELDKLDPLYDFFKFRSGTSTFPNGVQQWTVSRLKALISLENTSLNKNLYWLNRTGGWFESGLNFTFRETGGSIKVFKNNIEVAEINDNLQYFKIKFSGYGGDIFCPLDRTVTVLGLYHRYEPQLGIWYLTEELKLYKIGENDGGINLFAVAQWNKEDNLKWLGESANRGDLIRLISDPKNPRTLNRPNGSQTITSIEIDYLEKVLGFTWEPSQFAFIRKRD